MPWLSVVDFNNGRKSVFDTEKKITEKGLQESSTKILRKGQIIISARGTVGALAVLGKDMAFNQSCYGLNAKEDLTFNDYLYYLVKHNVSSLLNNTHGAVFDTITRETFDHISIELPTLPEQHSIASILSSLDDKIDLLHRQNKTLEALAETLFRQWFVEEVEGLEETNLDDVCLKTASGGTPSTKVSEYYGGSINWYSTKELNDNFLFESVSKITKGGLENSSAKLFPANTIVIAIYAAPTVGRLGILGNEACFNQAACGFIVDETKICFEYLYLHLLLSRQKLNDMASGSAQQNLNVGIIKSFPILLPSKVQMEEFRNQARPLFQKIKSNSIQIRTLTSLRDTLLPKLMSGEVRVEYENK